MKIYVYISLLFLVVACSKEKEPNVVDNSIPKPATPCTNNWVKPYEGYYKIRRRWPEFDSTLRHVTWTYDTVFMDYHLLYRDCNVLYYPEQKVSFPFDSTLVSTVNLSTTPGWTAFSTLILDTITDSIFIQDESGHLGRSFAFFVGRRE